MANMQPQAQRFAAGFTPLPTAARVTRQRGALRWRIVSTLISALILVAVVWWFGRDWSDTMTTIIIAAWVASSAMWLLLSWHGLHKAKKDLAAIQDGVAFYIDARGVEMVHPHPVFMAWDDISAMKLAGPHFGAGPMLVVEADGGTQAKVPVSFLDATPAAIDSVTRAYSLNKVRLDTRALDNIF